jgi:hypothetical protein
MKIPRSTNKVRPKKNEYMRDKAFADLKDALEGALAFERCERSDLNVARIQAPSPLKGMSPKDIARKRQGDTAHQRCSR